MAELEAGSWIIILCEWSQICVQQIDVIDVIEKLCKGELIVYDLFQIRE